MIAWPDPVCPYSIAPCNKPQVTLHGWEITSVGAHCIYAKLENGRKNFGVLHVYTEPQPDLRIYSEDILISPVQLMLGNPISFSATVHNASALAAAVNPIVYFYIGGIAEAVDIAGVPSIAASGSEYVTCNNSWTPEIEGVYVVGVELVPSFPQADVNYADNFATTSFCVSIGDADGDEVLGICDNCPQDPNPNQEDTYPPGGNGIGDACDCEANFDCDQDVDADDVTEFLNHFGRSQYFEPCTNADPCSGDFLCDGDVDADDVTKFLEDFGRSQYFNPCPVCAVGAWCVY